MGITQNRVVWITKRGAAFSLCTVNFAVIAKIRGIAKNQNFAMHSNFRYDSEFSLSLRNFRYHCEIFAIIAKFSLGLQNFRYHCEIFAILAKFSLCHSEIPEPLHCFMH